MAPEVFSLQPHDELVDMWSLGICLYYMLVGLFPFLANTLSGLEEAVTLHDVRFMPR
jgi:serine/threonine protein kinase